jgi:hypothetical protein
MPTYYVRPDGNDLNSGLTPTNAAGTGSYRTVNKALSVAVGGDTVWIAPGTYRENVTTSVALQAATISVKADTSLVQVAWGAGLTAGPVRITNFLTNDVSAASGITLSLTSKRYYYFEGIRFEGWFSLSYCRDISFYKCAWIGNETESLITVAVQSQAYADFIDFYRCSIINMPITVDGAYQNTSKSTYNYFRSCLIQICRNSARNNAWFEGVNGDKVNYGLGIFLNCTFIPGSSSPNYMFYHYDWGQYTVINCLILAKANTTTFYGARGPYNIVRYCYGLSLTTTGGGTTVSNSTTILYNSVDYGDNYNSGFSNYFAYTPHSDAIYLNAGSDYDYTIGWSITGYKNYPALDFFGNAWNLASTPTVGAIESRTLIPTAGSGGYVPLDRSIQTLTVTAGETGKSVHVYLGSTGVTFQTPNLTCYYARNNGTSVNIPLVAGNASTWVSGSLYEVSAVTMPGVYKFDVPNAVIEAGATTASIMLRGANAFNGAFVNINIEQPAQSAYLSTLGYKFLSEYAGSDGVLTVNKRTVTTVKCQIADTNGTAVVIGSSTMTVEVYTGSNVLLASYTPTIQYAGNGHVTFVLDTQITGTAGTYNAYAIRSASTTDRAVFGPLQIKVNEL